MRAFGAFAVAAVMAACGEGDAETASVGEATGAAVQQPASEAPKAADLTAMLAALEMSADADGLIENACGARVAPIVSPVDLGTAAAGSYLLVIPGGSDAPTCYGDGPGAVHVLTPDGDGYVLALVHLGYIGVLGAQTGGVADIALGGPGFSFPVVAWNGAQYEPAGRSVDDAAFGAATIAP